MISETPVLVANHSYLSASALAGQCIQNPLDLPPFPHNAVLRRRVLRWEEEGTI